MQTATSMYSQCYVVAGAENVLTEHIYNVEVSTVETDNCMEPSPSSETNSFSDGQKIPCIFKS
jgi:hypothetical protein